MTNIDSKIIECLTDKKDSFIGSLKDEITLAESRGFKHGLGWAIETIQSVNYSENNGWIKIESEADLPKENMKCYFILKSNNTMLAGKFFDGCFDYALRYYDQNDVTHYQPIIKPSLPLY